MACVRSFGQARVPGRGETQKPQLAQSPPSADHPPEGFFRVLPATGDGVNITDLPAHALSDAIRKREVSCREVMRATLERIEAVNPVHNAIVSLRDGDALLREADARDHQLRLGAPTGPIGWM